MNLKKLAIWKWNDYFHILFFHSQYARNPATV